MRLAIFAAFVLATSFAADPPATLAEHWLGHTQTVRRVQGGQKVGV